MSVTMVQRMPQDAQATGHRNRHQVPRFLAAACLLEGPQEDVKSGMLVQFDSWVQLRFTHYYRSAGEIISSHLLFDAGTLLEPVCVV